MDRVGPRGREIAVEDMTGSTGVAYRRASGEEESGYLNRHLSHVVGEEDDIDVWWCYIR